MIQPFFEKCKKVVGNKIFSGAGDKERSLSDGTENAVIYLRNQIGRTNASDINELKKKLIENVDDFIIERIVYAQDLLIKNGDKIIHDKRQEVILVYGNSESNTLEGILKAAHDAGKNMKVIVVDSAPDYLGRSMVKRLGNHGIKCQYTLISMVNFLI